METFLQILIGIFVVPLTALGLRSMFMPENMAAAVGLSAEGSKGLSEIRGVLGGLFLATAVMLVTGLVADETIWFLAGAFVMGGVLLGRFVGVVADGFDRDVVPPIIIEIVIGGVLVAAHYTIS